LYIVCIKIERYHMVIGNSVKHLVASNKASVHWRDHESPGVFFIHVKRALYIREKALYICKGAVYIRKRHIHLRQRDQFIHKRAACVRKRALYFRKKRPTEHLFMGGTCEKRLNIHKRAIHICKRALHICKRALQIIYEKNLRISSLGTCEQSPIYSQKNPLYPHKSPSYPRNRPTDF